MKTWSTLYSFFAIFMLLFMLVVLYKDIDTNEMQLEQMRLRYTLHYATEAGFQSAVDNSDLNLSYLDLQNAQLAPQDTLLTLKTVILMSYGMSLSTRNYAALDNNISSAVLAVDNGYYIATPKNYSSSELTWGLKKPYTIKYDADHVVAYDLSNEDWVLAEQNGSVADIQRGVHWSDLPSYIPAPTRESVTTAVNTEIMNDVNYSIKQRDKVIITSSSGRSDVGYTNDPGNNFVYLPTIQTTSGVNPILRPSLFVTMANVKFDGIETVSAESVSGYTIAKRRRVIGFVQDGKKYYCYEGQLADLSSVVNFFNTPEEAANAGYQPNLTDLTK